jgi:hypothetical protein
MPDSFPLPPWGSQPFDERDLDSLLAGKPDIPVALRPVAETLSALQAAPSARELRDEAFIRAQFRDPDRKAQIPTGQAAHTLEMPAVPGPRHRGGHRGNARRPTRGLFAGLVAAAAVVVLVLGAAVAYTGNLPGPVQRLAHDTIAAPSAKNVTSGASAGVEATSANPEPTHTHSAIDAPLSPASPSAKAPDRTALCNSFWAAMEHPHSRTWWRTPLYDRLSDAAGGPQRVFTYCAPVWQRKLAPRYPKLHAYPPYFPRQWNFGKPADGQGQGPGPAPGPGPGQRPGNDNKNITGPGGQVPSAPANGNDNGNSGQQGDNS